MDNLPVDVVKAMGADVIIAVDVGSAADRVDKEKLRSIGGILGRTYAIAQRPNSLDQLQRADIGIQPALADFTASQFHRVAELIPPGEAAARTKLSELSRYRVSAEDYAGFLAHHRRSNPQSPTISEVVVDGQQRVSEDAIRGRIRSRPGEPLDA